MMAALVPIPGKTGRPNTLSEDARARLLHALRLGTPREFAARAAGVSPRALFRWMAEGRRSKAGYFWQLWQDVEKAEAECVVRLLARIERAAEQGAWQAAAWKLERRQPGHFARKEATVVRAERGGVVYVHGVTRDEVRGTTPKPDETHA